MPSEPDYSKYVGLTASPMTAAQPLEEDALRRFVQAIMDDDPIYYDRDTAAQSKFGEICAPPFYPLHAFRRDWGTKDPLNAIINNRDADGAGDGADAYYGLEPIKLPYNRILNGGIEVESYRCLKIGEKAVARASYHSITPKTGASGDFVLVVVETRFTTESGELLMVSKHTVVWR